MSQKLSIASDHAGVILKQELIKHLEDKGVTVIDKGVNSVESVDYPDYAEKVANSILSGETDRGILICGSGIGMSIAANKFKGIRAALCHDSYTAKMSRLHNDANILVLGSQVVGLGVARDMVDAWFTGSFEGGRHINRINKLDR